MHPLVMRLNHFVHLTADDASQIENLESGRQPFAAHIDIANQGDVPHPPLCIVQGWAYRYCTLPDGSRQISAFLIPGDLAGLCPYRMDHSLGTLSRVLVAELDTKLLSEGLLSNPRLTASFWCSILQDQAMLRERIASLGRRNAYGRIAHLFCELYLRLKTVGKVVDGGFVFPVTQSELADALGMTVVHANRTLRRLRDDGHIAFATRSVIIRDFTKFADAAAFDPAYLNLDGPLGGNFGEFFVARR
jgi:CRP-like cAMP-binding protein